MLACSTLFIIFHLLTVGLITISLQSWSIAVAATHALLTLLQLIAKGWRLSETLLARYGEGFCDSCGHGPRHLGYPAWWLRAVNYSAGRVPHTANQPNSTQASKHGGINRHDRSYMRRLVLDVKQCIGNCAGHDANTYESNCVDQCLLLRGSQEREGT